MNEIRQRYQSPDGNWYENPEEELNHHVGCLENCEDAMGVYDRIGSVYIGVGLIYSGIRFLGLVNGIGPEIDVHAEASTLPAMLDVVAFTLLVFGGIGKACAGLMYFDVRSSRKDINEAQERLGLEVAVNTC